MMMRFWLKPTFPGTHTGLTASTTHPACRRPLPFTLEATA
jgi:hypothetical protein